jgi:Phage integrase, N-terminal SAM-like domain
MLPPRSQLSCGSCAGARSSSATFIGAKRAAQAGDVACPQPAWQFGSQRRTAAVTQRRPKPWAEKDRHGRIRYVWRFQERRHRTTFYDDPEDARADATAQITEQIKGSWQERSGPQMLLEDWIDLWVEMLGDIEPTTRAKYRYFVEGHILPAFQGRQLGSLTFEEIEMWDHTISTKISARGRPTPHRSRPRHAHC